MKLTDLASVEEAAGILKVTPRRVLALIAAGSLPAKQIGRDYVLIRRDVESMPRRKPGRPAAEKK